MERVYFAEKDYVIRMLVSTRESTRFFSRNRFALCNSHFVNSELHHLICNVLSYLCIFRQIFLKKLKLDTVRYFPKYVVLYLISQVWNSTLREAKMAILPINKKFHSSTDLSLSNLSKN